MRRLVAPLARSSSRATAAARRPLTTYGNAANGVKPVTASAIDLHDIVGLPSVATSTSVGQRLQAGDLLGLIDVCAARCAQKHIWGVLAPPQPGAAATSEDDAASAGAPGDDGSSPPRQVGSVVTASMDRILFRQPVLNGDQIILRGRVVDAGTASVAINVDVQRLQFGSKKEQFVADAIVFMVAVDHTLRPAKVVPAVSIDESEPALAPLLARHCAAQDAKATMKRMHVFEKQVDALSDPAAVKATVHPPLKPVPKPQQMQIKETELKAHRIVFPQYMNMNDTLFGGELLRWMEFHAVHCGRVFAHNRNVVSIGMHALEFTEPVYKSDWLRLSARVVYVQSTTMEVDVRVTAERGDRVITTNRAHFVLASIDELGAPLEVRCGLDTADANVDLLRRHVVAHQRYHWLRQQAGKEEPPEVMA